VVASRELLIRHGRLRETTKTSTKRDMVHSPNQDSLKSQTEETTLTAGQAPLLYPLYRMKVAEEVTPKSGILQGMVSMILRRHPGNVFTNDSLVGQSFGP